MYFMNIGVFTTTCSRGVAWLVGQGCACANIETTFSRGFLLVVHGVLTEPSGFWAAARTLRVATCGGIIGGASAPPAPPDATPMCSSIFPFPAS